jgi:hypothetical protein
VYLTSYRSITEDKKKITLSGKQAVFIAALIVVMAIVLLAM